jgi:hypothetical protein
VATYDKLDWHYDAAIAAGQPPENAFTHIGLYLAWLIRHDLHDPNVFPAAHIAAVKSGQLSGSDLADDVDTKLIPPVMNREGQAFSDARYRAYLDEFAVVFADEPDYGVVDEPANYLRIAPAIDRLYTAWVADGRPMLPPEPDNAVDEAAAWETGLDFAPPLDMSIEQIQAVRDAIAAELGGVVMRPPTRDEMPHAAPDLEALLRADLTDPPLETSSVSGSDWGSSLFNHALKQLGVHPRDALVVTGMGGTGGRTLTVILYGLPGASAERLMAEFSSVIYLPGRAAWTEREIDGRRVKWASSSEFVTAFWALDGLVVQVSGRAEDVEKAAPRLP